jgi:hypothetical protein
MDMKRPRNQRACFKISHEYGEISKMDFKNLDHLKEADTKEKWI